MIKLTDVSVNTEPIKAEDDLDNRLKKHCNELLNAATLLKSGNANASFSIDKERTLLTESKTIENICHDYLINRGKASLSYAFTKELVSVDIIKVNNGYRFVFGELFPSRANIINKSILKGYSRTLSHGYRPAIEEKMNVIAKEDKSIRFNTKVAVVVTHFFADESQLKDYDNLESKPITDVITPYFIKDDSPQYMSLHYEYAFDNHPHSEILITSEEEYFRSKLA